jgi:hypothetical protein
MGLVSIPINPKPYHNGIPERESNAHPRSWRRSCWDTVQRDIQSIVICFECFLICWAIRVEVLNNDHSVIVFVIRAYCCLLYFEWVDISPASKCHETLGIQQNLCIWTLAAFQDLPNSNTLNHSGLGGLTRMLDPCMESMTIKGVDWKGKSRQGCIILCP